MTARSWTLQGLASATLAAALVNGALAQAPSTPVKPAATVNGEPITVSELEMVLKLRPPMPTQPTEVQRRQIQLEALSLLIDDEVMRQFLRKNAPAVSPADVNKKFADFEASLKQQGRTLDDFQKDSGQTEAQVRSNIANMLQWSAYVKQHLTDADVLNYYNENREFFDQVTVRASHIVLRLSPSSSAAEHETARTRLQALRQDILAGKIDFAEAAKKNSQCPSAPNGGDIGYFPRKWAVDEAFARAAFALQKGDVSDIVQTDYGLHLIKVTDRKPGQPSNFEKIKDEVREMAAEDMRQTLLAQQRKLATVVINLFEDQNAQPATH